MLRFHVASAELSQWLYRSLPASYFNTDALWIGYPHIPMPAPVKFFYIVQCSFYVHAIMLLNAEAHRKDHWQMMTHHIITVVLIGLSYFYNFTRVGCMVLVTMDWCDMVFSVSQRAFSPSMAPSSSMRAARQNAALSQYVDALRWRVRSFRGLLGCYPALSLLRPTQVGLLLAKSHPARLDT
jgi:hypothetical protein